jgi:hypothetical protein
MIKEIMKTTLDGNCPDSGGTVPIFSCIFMYFGFLAIIYAHVVVIFLAMVNVGMSISKCVSTKVSIPAKSTESIHSASNYRSINLTRGKCRREGET